MEDVFPQVAFRIANIPVRDTVISTWIMIALIIGLALILRRRLPVAVEMLIDFLNDMISDVIGRPALTFVPLLGTLMLFIAVANIIGVVPLMVTPTKDINTPLALAVVVLFMVHYFGFRERGAWGYIKGQLSPLIILDVIGQLSRTMSLTLRLFGNVISTEIVVAVIFSLVPVGAPLPMIALSMFSGVLQAYIFTILASNYVASSIE